MADLYSRLKEVGFDAKFVKGRVLPDWWDDSLASVPANRAIAEAAIAKMLRFPIQDLEDPTKKLRLPAVGKVRLKKRAKTTLPDLRPSILIAEQAARAVVETAQALPHFENDLDAAALRREILEGLPFVNLEALLQAAWGKGIVVLHLSQLPAASKKFSGVSLFRGDTPVIVLASGTDSPPWLAFHLAHELGHIAHGHVKPGDTPLAHGEIGNSDHDPEELEANEFACYVLTGEKQPRFASSYGLTGSKLAFAARDYGRKNKIDPGAVALFYGRTAERLPAAQVALRHLGVDRGGHATIWRFLQEHLVEEPSEYSSRFIPLLDPGS